MQAKGMVTGMEITKGIPPTPSEPCLKGETNPRRNPEKTPDTRADVGLSRIFSDVCGRMIKAHGNSKYFVYGADDKSRKVFVDGFRLKVRSHRLPQDICGKCRSGNRESRRVPPL